MKVFSLDVDGCGVDILTAEAGSGLGVDDRAVKTDLFTSGFFFALSKGIDCSWKCLLSTAPYRPLNFQPERELFAKGGEELGRVSVSVFVELRKVVACKLVNNTAGLVSTFVLTPEASAEQLRPCKVVIRLIFWCL